MIEMQRSRLLGAIVEIVGEEGLDGARVGCLCRRAGVSRRTFYDLFDDREACLLAAFEYAIGQFAQWVVPTYTTSGPWRGRIGNALAGLLESLDEQPALARLCVIEASKAGPAVLGARRRTLDALIAAVDEGRSEAKRTVANPAITAESTVGGILAVVHARLSEHDMRPLAELAGPLASMIVHPYLGSSAARRELERPVPTAASVRHDRPLVRDPFRDLPIRITFRTSLVLGAVAGHPGASNRRIADAAEVPDQGQISKLLQRLANAGLIVNTGEGRPKGEPNAWVLTSRGKTIHAALGARNTINA